MDKKQNFNFCVEELVLILNKIRADDKDKKIIEKNYLNKNKNIKI